MANTTNYNWETPDDTDLVKDGAAAIRTLGSSIDTTTKNLNPSTTLGDIEYRSSTANVNTRLPLGTAGQVLKVNSGATAPEWATDASGMTNPMTTTGDTIYSSSGSTPARLGIGTAGQVLQVNSGATAPEWATPASGTPAFVGCSLYKSTFQNISSSTYTAITWDSEFFDTDAYHNTSTNTSRITIPSGKTGKYLLTGSIAFSSSSAEREILLYKGGNNERFLTRIGGTVNGNYSQSFATIISLSATNYIEIYVYIGAASNSLDGGTDETLWQLQYLGA
jgi:hypothetical protein